MCSLGLEGLEALDLPEALGLANSAAPADEDGPLAKSVTCDVDGAAGRKYSSGGGPLPAAVYASCSRVVSFTAADGDKLADVCIDGQSRILGVIKASSSNPGGPSPVFFDSLS